MWICDGQTYLCPFDTIVAGNYVLLDSKKGNSFSIGEVLEVGEENTGTAYTFVICRLLIKDFYMLRKIKIVKSYIKRKY